MPVDQPPFDDTRFVSVDLMTKLNTNVAKICSLIGVNPDSTLIVVDGVRQPHCAIVYSKRNKKQTWNLVVRADGTFDMVAKDTSLSSFTIRSEVLDVSNVNRANYEVFARWLKREMARPNACEIHNGAEEEQL